MTAAKVLDIARAEINVKDSVPDTLIQYTLGAGGVEALLLASIKISKVRAGDKPGESEENHEEEL